MAIRDYFLEIIKGAGDFAEYGHRTHSHSEDKEREHQSLGNAGRPDRNLDIYETGSGVCRYTFTLNATHDSGIRLLFAKDQDPFIELPINSSTGETFLKDFQIDDVGEWGARRASFVCDLDEVRNSELAGRIRKLDGHSRFLNVPFCFNFYDPGIAAAPWVVPDHAIYRGHGHNFTHGGVHPSAAAFLTVELDEGT